VNRATLIVGFVLVAALVYVAAKGSLGTYLSALGI
jgi:hypothetical protein